jgi:hypothetical protein
MVVLKTLHVSGNELLSKNKYAINWFSAFCHRRVADANWLKNDPRQLQDIRVDTPNKHRIVVLQRITFNQKTIEACGVIEQYQFIGRPSDRRC